MSFPLEGYTVVAAEQAVAAPLATRHLADLGARVIKIERIGGGDLARGYDQVVLGAASHFVWLNRGKESLAVDLKDERGSEVVRRLIARADVFIQNLAPGTAARLGFGAETLRREHPRLITADLSGYGSGGPMEGRKAYDLLVQAESGLISITGTPAVAVKSGIPVADIASGMYCAQAILAALLRRERTGEGAAIEVTMLEAMAEWMGHPLYVQMFANREVPRMGLGHAVIAPYGSYPTADGEVLVGIQNDSGWRTLVTEVFDRPDLAEHPRFVSNVLRVQNRVECDDEVSKNTRAWTTAELTARLTAAGIPFGQINAVRDLVNHPQLHARDRWRQVQTECGPVPALLPPITFKDVEAAMGDVPALGQHTRRVLNDAGLGDGQAEQLIADGIALQHLPRPAAPEGRS
jgi:crotonobetainyl-CoA:carnitine CoA-transferase CaiB-like acyl-CoA transferase